jgi:uncharacterized Zn-binding protein involved in type VI secretion
MPVTVTANGLTVVHRSSGGVAMATAPDVCKTPAPGGPIPVPYPNVALSADLVLGTTTVMVDGASAAVQGSKFAKSTGDEAGVAGGVVSAVIIGEAEFISFSPTVSFEGKPVCRLTDKMLMNKGNTVCMGGVLQSPAVPAPPLLPPEPCGPTSPAPPPEAPKRCVVRTVLVSCAHSSRKLTVDLSKRELTVLQVIATETTPETLTVEWDGTCGSRHAYCPSVGVKTLDSWYHVDRTTHAVKLPAPSDLLARDWLAVFKLLCSQRSLKPDHYTLVAMSCQGKERASVQSGQWLQVQVFPEAEWNAKMKFGYVHKNQKDDAGNNKALEYERSASWKFTGAADYKYGSYSGKYEASTENEGEALPLFGSLLDKIGRSAKVLECMGSYGADVELTPSWPNWELSGGLKLAEVPGKPIVGSEGKFKFGFDPLFGIKLKVSLLDWLIRFAGALTGGPLLAGALVQVRRRFGKGAGSASSFAQGSLDLDITLTVGGSIKGSIGYKYVEGQPQVDPTASLLDGGIELQIEGHVRGKGRIWRLTAGAGGEVGSSAAEAHAIAKIGSPTADSIPASRFGARLSPKAGTADLSVKGQVFFSGLAIYYLLYVEVGIAGAENKEKNKLDFEATARASGTKRLIEKRGVCVLMEPWAWP